MKPFPPTSIVSTPFLAAVVLVVSFGLGACATPPGGDPSVAPADAQAGGGIFTGAVVETMDAGGYTYMRLQAEGKDVWVAADAFAVTMGEAVTVPLEMPMVNFHSTTLDRDFSTIYFVTQIARGGASLQAVPAAGLPTMPMASHGASGAAAQASGPPVVKPNAPPAGGLSIADTWSKRESLSGAAVTVRGTVVKVNNAIMGFNWFHLQDGSGRAADGTNDLTVTTDAIVKVGDVVTLSGILGVKKDFGAGYAYDAILENAIIK